MKYDLRLLLSALLFFLITPISNLYAKDYIIDVVIFENVNPHGPSGFSNTLYYPSMKKTLQLGSSKSDKARFIHVKSSEQIMNIVKKIQSSRDYRLLKHITWQQPGLPENKAKGVRINTGPVFDIKIANDSKSINGLIEAISPETPSSAENNYRDITAFTPQDTYKSLRSTELAGSLSISLGKYLHLNTRLVLTHPDGQSSTKMLLTRRMRSKEIHYLDTPSLGLVILITPKS